MAVDVKKLTLKEIENYIENHVRHNATGRPFYLELLNEQGVRKGRGLTFAKSCGAIRKAAAERRFLSYKELADASGAEWTQVHYAIGGHLWELVEYAHRQGWPMLSAIVVNKTNVEAGEMEPETLKGFLGAARLLGFAVGDEREFLKDQQEKVFAWAGGNSGAVIG